MKQAHQSKMKPRSGEALHSELLILPDGRILVHNLTKSFADMLSELNPSDGTIRTRVGSLHELAAPEIQV